MPLGKKLSRRLKKTFSFKSRGNYDLTPKVDQTRQRKHKDSDRSSSESEGVFRQPTVDPVGLAGSGLGIGSVYSLQHSPQVLRASSSSTRPSAGSLNDLPGSDGQLPTPSPLTVDAKPKFVFTSRGGTVTAPAESNAEVKKSSAKEIKHFVKGVSFPESKNTVENGDDVEINVIYQRLGFKHGQTNQQPVKKHAPVTSFAGDEIEDPDYSTIPSPGSTQASSGGGHDVLSSTGIDLESLTNTGGSETLNFQAKENLKLTGYDDEDPGYSTVPQVREDLKVADTKLSLSIKNDDPGYETLDETRKKIEALKNSSKEGSGGAGFSSPKSNLPELLYDSAAFCNAKQSDPVGIYDNVNFPNLSGETFSNSSGSPEDKQDCSAVGVNVLSSQDSGIDTSGPGSPKVTSPPRLVKLSTTNKQAHEGGQSVDKHSDNTSDISFTHMRSQSSGVSREPSHVLESEDCLYSTVGSKSRSSIEISSIVDNTSELNIMDADDIAPPIPSRNYLKYMSAEESNQASDRTQTVGTELDREGNVTHVSGTDTADCSNKPSTSSGISQSSRSVSAGKSKSQNDIKGGATNKEGVTTSDRTHIENRSSNTPRGAMGESAEHLSEAEVVMRVAKMTVSGSKRSSGEKRRSSSGQSSACKRDSANGNSSETPHSPGGSAEFSHVDFINSLEELKESGWYWGPLSACEAEAKLAGKPDGSFLVRDSSDERYILSISFNSQGATHHTRIEHYKGYFSFYSQPSSHGYGTIVEFIQRVMEHSRNGSFSYFLRPSAPGSPPMQVRLLYPVSRLRVMCSLQHMCRFLILKHVRCDHIDKLPLPDRVLSYLKEKQYYIEYLED